MERVLVHLSLDSPGGVDGTCYQRVRRLICIFAGRTSLIVGFVVRWLKYIIHNTKHLSKRLPQGTRRNRFEQFARIFSRRHKLTTFLDAGFLGILRINVRDSGFNKLL